MKDALAQALDRPNIEKRFELALGRFTIAFADAEHLVFEALVGYAKVSDKVGRAVFSGTRLKGMVDFIRAIAHNTEMAQKRFDDLDDVLAQLLKINTARDTILHHVTDFYLLHEEDWSKRLVINERTSRIGKRSGHVVDAASLDDMTHDLKIVQIILRQHWKRTRFRRRDAPSPWLYKQLLPVPGLEESPRKPPQPSARPPALKKTSKSRRQSTG
jgi:hypothetical protein